MLEFFGIVAALVFLAALVLAYTWLTKSVEGRHSSRDRKRWKWGQRRRST